MDDFDSQIQADEGCYGPEYDAWLDSQNDDYAERDQFMSDAEADADALASIGWGTDEDYGYYGDFDDYAPECYGEW